MNKITVDWSKVLKNWLYRLFRFLWATRYRPIYYFYTACLFLLVMQLYRPNSFRMVMPQIFLFPLIPLNSKNIFLTLLIPIVMCKKNALQCLNKCWSTKLTQQKFWKNKVNPCLSSVTLMRKTDFLSAMTPDLSWLCNFGMYHGGEYEESPVL